MLQDKPSDGNGASTFFGCQQQLLITPNDKTSTLSRDIVFAPDRTKTNDLPGDIRDHHISDRQEAEDIGEDDTPEHNPYFYWKHYTTVELADIQPNMTNDTKSPLYSIPRHDTNNNTTSFYMLESPSKVKHLKTCQVNNPSPSNVEEISETKNNLMTCAIANNKDDLTDYPNGNVEYIRKIDQSIGPRQMGYVGWAMYERWTSGHASCKTHLKYCLGNYKCPIYGCTFSEQPRVPRGKKVDNALPMPAKQICPTHLVSPKHIPCNAKLKLVTSPTQVILTHYGFHLHQHPHPICTSLEAS